MILPKSKSSGRSGGAARSSIFLTLIAGSAIGGCTTMPDPAVVAALQVMNNPVEFTEDDLQALEAMERARQEREERARAVAWGEALRDAMVITGESDGEEEQVGPN